MATATWVKNELEQQHVPYQELHHPQTYSAQAVAQEEHVSGHRVAKVVIALADARPLALVLPASRRVRLDLLGELLAARQVRLAREDELRNLFPDCEVGAIPPLRHWPGIEVIMDGALRTDADIVFQGGTHSDAVRLRFDDWFQMVKPRVEAFSEPADGCAIAGSNWEEEGEI
jgi:Ala-tRNA(Pro) deacylase